MLAFEPLRNVPVPPWSFLIWQLIPSIALCGREVASTSTVIPPHSLAATSTQTLLMGCAEAPIEPIFPFRQPPTSCHVWHIQCPIGTFGALRARVLLSGWWALHIWRYYNYGELQHLFKHRSICECSLLNRYVTFQGPLGTLRARFLNSGWWATN